MRAGTSTGRAIGAAAAARVAIRFAGVGLIAGLAACAGAPPAAETDPRSGAVAMRSIDKQLLGADRLPLAANETFQMPLAEPGNAAPAYPEDLLAQRLAPQTVCLNLAIGADGAVAGSRAVERADGCPTPDTVDPRFFAAAQAAVAQWRFDPAFRCVYPGAKPAEEQGCVSGREEAVAVSLAFRFVFEQRDGRGLVRIGG